MKLKDAINEIDDLVYDTYCLPKEYWNEYLDCEVRCQIIGKDFKNIAILDDECVAPFVIMVRPCNGVKYLGHGTTISLYSQKFHEAKSAYFLTENGGITRNVNEAKVIWISKKYMFQICYSSTIFKMPIGYEFFDVAYKWLAQEKIDKEYPLPRKSISKKTREEVYNKFNGKCAYCGENITIEEMQVDHIKSHKRNCGTDSIDNYYPACDVCNRVKTDYTLEEFKQAIRHCGYIHRHRDIPINADSDKIARKYGLEKEDKEIKFYFEECEDQEDE